MQGTTKISCQKQIVIFVTQDLSSERLKKVIESLYPNANPPFSIEKRESASPKGLLWL